MKHAELLHDSQSIERGNEMIELFIQGLKQLRKDGRTESETSHNYARDIKGLIDSAIERNDMEDAELAQLGASVIEARRKQLHIQAWRQIEENGTPEWQAAFHPAIDFLSRHTGNPIAVEDTSERGNDIIPMSFRAQFSSRKIGGFIIPIIIGNAQLDIASRPGSNKATARLQVYDRITTDTYGSNLRIAIAEQSGLAVN